MSPSRRTFLEALGAGSVALIAGSCATGRPSRLPAAVPAAEGRALIRLGSNENSHGPGPAALAAIENSIGESNRYPFGSVGELHAAIARHAGVSGSQVVMSCGSGDLLDAAASAFASPARGLVTAAPSFEAPARRAAAMGAPIVSVPVDPGGRLDLDAMLARVQGAGLIYVCNPNNPTATICGAADVRAFVEHAASRNPDAVVLIDEAYHEYVADPAYATAIPLATGMASVVVTRTFSKLHGMAGLRMGYAVAQPGTLARMRPWLSATGMNVLAAEAARAALGDTTHVERQRALNREARRVTLESFARAGRSAFASEANFLMVDVGRDCRQFAAACAAHGVRIARPFPPLLQHARITIGTMDEMSRALAVFGEVLASAPSASASYVPDEWQRSHGC